VSASDHLDRVRRQFTRQADAYADLPQTKGEAGLDALVGLAGARSGDDVLDVACGPGWLTLAFARRGARAVGIDATPAFVERAREEAARRALAPVAFGVGDVQALPVRDASFDVVACRAAFHHFPWPGRVLREMRRVARPQGRLLVADMLGSEDSTKAAYHDRIERLCDPTHVRAVPASEFARLFAGAGLAIVAQKTGSVSYDVEEWMAHGGPSPEAAREIVALFEHSLDTDRSGLAVRRDAGRLRFRHTVATYVVTGA
jgi:ubiquinone/menaquinone biosynthesis C-methylase UbiE